MLDWEKEVWDNFSQGDAYAAAYNQSILRKRPSRLVRLGSDFYQEETSRGLAEIKSQIGMWGIFD